MDPKLAGSDFIDLGDIIVCVQYVRITDIFQKLYGDDEMQQFNDDSTKEFFHVSMSLNL